MRAAGIDIGSRTVKLVVLDDGDVVHRRVEYNSHDPIETCRTMLDGIPYERIVATGYGRHLFARYRPCDTITEIKAVALGARSAIPTCRTILDIGGQDTKAISLDENGALKKFEMNDKCAAGTGRFLEIMASTLGYSMADFVREAGGAVAARSVNAMCTVFIESEIVSLVAQGAPREEIALGVHQSVARRATAMLGRVRVDDDLVFSGGAALNACLRDLVRNAVGRPVIIDDHPQTLAALGAALSALRLS
jgi:predicted CoA-substrate-specific enzyme activase